MIAGIRKCLINDARGITLVELLTALVIGIIALAGTIKIFTTQQGLLIDENDGTKVRAKGRQAIKILAREVRMAGFGLPEYQGIDPSMNPLPAPAITNSISYRTNRNFDGQKAARFLDASAGTAASGSSFVTLLAEPSAAGAVFADQDKIVIYNPNQLDEVPAHYTLVNGAVSNTSTVLNFADPLPGDLEFTPLAKVILANRYSDYTINMAGDQIMKTVDGNTIPLVNNVNAGLNGGLRFHFRNGLGADAASTTEVETVTITLAMADPKNADAAIEFKTDVKMRNSDTSN